MFLQESSNANLIFNLTPKVFDNHFKSVKLVEKGSRVDSKNNKLYFVRYMFQTKAKINSFFTMEFLSLTKDMEFIHSVYTYDLRTRKEMTIYADEGKTIQDFIEHTKNLGSLKSKPLPLNKATSESGLFLAASQKANEGGGMTLGQTLLYVVGPMIALGITFATYIIWLGKQYMIQKDQNYAETKAEEELNEFLFKDQKKDDSAFQVYGNTTSHIDNVINGTSRALILYGQPGTSKTYLVRRALHFSGLKPGTDYAIFKGSSGNAEQNTAIIYETLWRHNGKIVVFDDFDSALTDENSINLLKVALDSYPVRILSLPERGYFLDQQIPNKFKYTGRMIIITNKTEIDSALKSRAVSLYINYTPVEFKDQIGKLLKFLSPQVPMEVKEEVFEFVSKEISKDKGAVIDFRRFGAIVDLRVAYPEGDEWKNMAMEVLYNKKK
jgi:hypothetical protein